MYAITIRKVVLTLFSILSFQTLMCQTTLTVGFAESNQKFDLSSNTIELSLKIKRSKKNKTEFLNLMIYNDSEDYKNVLDGKSNETGFNKIIAVPKEENDKIKIRIPINKNSLKNSGYFSLRLEKKDKSQKFEIINNVHTIVFSKKASTELGFKRLDETIKTDLSKVDKIEIPFKVVSSGFAPKEDDNVRVEIGLKGVKDLSILANAKKEYKIVGGEYSDKFIIDITEDKKKKLDSLINNNVTLEILKISHSNNDKKIIIVNSKSKQKKIHLKDDSNTVLGNRYSFYLGTNFDLEDRFEATSFYSEIDAWLPELIGDDWGIRAGIYKNNNSRSLEEDKRIESIVDIISIAEDSIAFQSKRVQTLPSIKTENFGLYLEAMFNLVDKKEFKAYLAGHFEVIRRNEEFTFNSTDILPFNQKKISLDSLSRNIPLQRLLERPKTVSREYFDSYYGIGLPMNYYNSKKKFSIFLNPVIGIGHLGLDLRDEKGKLINPTQAFGIFQFSLIEEDVGIKLSGEVRKFFGSIQEPIISVSLSKTINLSGLLKKEEESD